MSVSYDVNKDLETFRAFLEFVQNPKKYLEIIQAIEKGVENHKNIVAKYEAIGPLEAQKEKAAKLVEDANLLLEDSKKEAEALLVKTKLEIKSLKDVIGEKQQALSNTENKLKDKEVMLSDKEATLLAIEKELDAKLGEAEQVKVESLTLKKEYEEKKKALLGVLS